MAAMPIFLNNERYIVALSQIIVMGLEVVALIASLPSE